MKNIILALCLFISVSAFGRDGVRSQYDEEMKDAGKWGFISNSMYLTALFGAGASYYSYNRANLYKELGKERDLSLHEQEEYAMWLGASKLSGYVGGGALIIGLIGMGASIQYENRAHQFALDMKVEF